jgi:hypothetical protein
MMAKDVKAVKVQKRTPLLRLGWFFQGYVSRKITRKRTKAYNCTGWRLAPQRVIDHGTVVGMP